MAKKVKCVFFKAVNGTNTGVYTRTAETRTASSPGILFMKNCPDGKTFYCNPASDGTANGKNGYLKLIDPQLYKLSNYKSGTTVWMWIDKSCIKTEVYEETPPSPPKPDPPKNTTVVDYSIKGPNIKEQDLTYKGKTGSKIIAIGEYTTQLLK